MSEEIFTKEDALDEQINNLLDSLKEMGLSKIDLMTHITNFKTQEERLDYLIEIKNKTTQNMVW